MSNSNLIKFFKELESYTKFERIKYIYELTNNLEIDLLFDLREAYIVFCLSLKTKIQYQNSNTSLGTLTSEDFKIKNQNQFSTYIETHLKDYKECTVEDVIDEMLFFIDEIDDLVKRKLSDLPKNSRHKNNLNYFQNVDENPSYIDVYAHTGGDDIENTGNDVLIDLSDSSLVGKIIYLEKLGVIDYLRTKQPFNTSINSIATILSALTGAKPTSIQPLLNSLLGKDVNSKNNPLNSVKTVHVVEQKLLKIGFEPKK